MTSFQGRTIFLAGSFEVWTISRLSFRSDKISSAADSKAGLQVGQSLHSLFSLSGLSTFFSLAAMHSRHI